MYLIANIWISLFKYASSVWQTISFLSELKFAKKFDTHAYLLPKKYKDLKRKSANKSCDSGQNQPQHDQVNQPVLLMMKHPN